MFFFYKVKNDIEDAKKCIEISAKSGYSNAIEWASKMLCCDLINGVRR